MLHREVEFIPVGVFCVVVCCFEIHSWYVTKLALNDLPASASQVLRSQELITMPSKKQALGL